MRTKQHFYLSVLTILSLLLAPVSVLAGTASPAPGGEQAGSIKNYIPLVVGSGVNYNSAVAVSPFLGEWWAIDADGSDIRLTIAGPPYGPFQITWTESYISYCGGEAGIIRGTGQLNFSDPYMLEAELHLRCFTTGDSLDFQATWIYDPGSDTITSDFITWHRSSATAKKCTPPPLGLTGWWPGDGDAADMVAGRDGIFHGDAGTGSGLVDLAFHLDGDGDFIEVPHDPALNAGFSDFTIDLWVNFIDTSGEQVLVEKWIQSDPILGWTLTKLESNVLRLGMGSVDHSEHDVDSGELDLFPGRWYHFAAVRQGTTVRLYLNGDVIAEDTEVPAINLNTNAPLKFGHRGFPDERGFFLNGRIDEVELFIGAALSAEQIMTLYQAGSAGKCKDGFQPPPRLDLRVNYGHDWVESFYEAGHMVWITVTEGDGVIVKATAEVLTEPKNFWGGETGFQTNAEDWNPAPPDIQPYDWVYAWVDNGAFAQVQIGDISGAIDLAEDSIQGTIYAPWFESETLLDVECHPWGAPEPEAMKLATAYPDGENPYTCSWAGEWDIQPGQDVGVGYFGPDGHWVANSFPAPNPRIVASESGDWFWFTEFYPGILDLSIYESADPGVDLLWKGQQEALDLWGVTSITPDIHGQDLLPGNYVIVSDGVNEKSLILETITMEVFDTENEIIAGTALPGRDVWAAAGPQDWQEHIMVTADSDTGAWLADFKTIEFDITEDMRPWSYAQVFDEDGDANEANPPPSPHFVVFPEWEWFDGLDWPDGATVYISVEGKTECDTSVESWGGFFNGNFGESCDVVTGDKVTFTDGATPRTHVVRNLAITDLDLAEDTVTGSADPDTLVYVWPHDGWFEPLQATAGESGYWRVDLGDMAYDLREGSAGRSEIRDEMGNATAVDWYVPNPRFTVWPESDQMDGSEWPDGSVTVTVEGKSECSTEKISEGGYFHEPFPEGCDITVDDVVTFFDGVTTRSHTVRNLAVTAVDQELDTVAGTADIGEGVSVGAYDSPGESEVYLTVEDGAWLANFTLTGIDLVEGMCGYARVGDEAGNVTQVDWCVPLAPMIIAHPDENWVEGWNFTEGSVVTLTIFGPQGNPRYEGTQVADYAEWNPSQTYVQFNLDIDLLSGDHIWMSDETDIKDLTVTKLQITEINLDERTVSGLAESSSEVQVEYHPGLIFSVTADELGYWTASVENLEAGIPGLASQWDDDGDMTRVVFYIPKMELRVNYGHDWVESFYEAGHTVWITVTESDGETIKATAEVVTEPKEFWGWESGFQTNPEDWYPELPNIQPHDWVYAWVDNGASAQVQLGDIQGEVNFMTDSIEGTIDASWLTDAVSVECLDWGSGGEPINKDAGVLYTDGIDPYSCNWDPETEWDVQPWQDIGIGYSTPEGHWVANAFRDERWMAVWTYDPPTGHQEEGQHSYFFDLAYTVPEEVDYPPGDPRTYTVAGGTPVYGGYALLGPWDYMPIQVWNGSECELVSALNPVQAIRFISGWVNDYSMTYEEALAHFSSITVDLSWDEEAIDSTSFTMIELLPFYSRDDRTEYICTFTEHP